MLPTSKTKPKASLFDLTALVYGPSKIGKCLSGNTILYDPANGRPVSLREVVASEDKEILTMKEAGVIASQRPSARMENEPAQLFRMTTQTGRSIEATANHPFLTREGWKPLEELGVGDRVAVVAEYPELFGLGDTDDELIKIMAYLIADGSLDEDHSPVFTKGDLEVRMDFEVAVEAKGDECIEFVTKEGVTHVRIRGKHGSRNNVIAFLKEVGLHGLRSGDKFIPDFVFGLKKPKLKLFLNRLFTCDGSVEAKGRVSYSSKSMRMVMQIQHLLARFGIVGIVRERRLNGEPYGAELQISSKRNVLAFLDEIGVIGEKAVAAEAIRSNLYNIRGAETQLDRLGPILFDRIMKIEPTLVEPVFDLTVDGSHNFIANDFVVHNSTWCSQAHNTLFLATEPGLNALEVFQVNITTWDEMLQACQEIAEGKHDFKTIVIDTVDNAYRMCSDYVCKKFKIEHESDLGYGKGYALINNEFQRVLNKLAFLPYGLILISHSQERDIETRTGSHTRIVPTLPEKVRKVVTGLVDMILFCDLEMKTGEDGKPVWTRVMRTKPSPNYDAGDRTGKLPEVLPLDFQAFEKSLNAATTTPVSQPASASQAAATAASAPAQATSKPTTMAQKR